MPYSSGPSGCPSYWQQACRELSARDAVLKALIRRFNKSHLEGGDDAFITLCRAIVGQQISVPAADSVWQRLAAHFAAIKPLAIQRCRLQTLHRCGLSAQKADYLKNVARFFVYEKIDAAYWQRYEIEALQSALLNIKGVGLWTFQMFAIFYLKYPNILPLNDLGLVRAIDAQYNHGEKLSAPRLEEITARWQPWCTVATWYLWRSIDPKAVIY